MASQWKCPEQPRPKEVRQIPSNVNILLTVFIDCNGVVRYEFLPQGLKATNEYYLEVMRRLREAIH